jgi:hypothetical protein
MPVLFSGLCACSRRLALCVGAAVVISLAVLKFAPVPHVWLCLLWFVLLWCARGGDRGEAQRLCHTQAHACPHM